MEEEWALGEAFLEDLDDDLLQALGGLEDPPQPPPVPHTVTDYSSLPMPAVKPHYASIRTKLLSLIQDDPLTSASLSLSPSHLTITVHNPTGFAALVSQASAVSCAKPWACTSADTVERACRRLGLRKDRSKWLVALQAREPAKPPPSKRPRAAGTASPDASTASEGYGSHGLRYATVEDVQAVEARVARLEAEVAKPRAAAGVLVREAGDGVHRRDIAYWYPLCASEGGNPQPGSVVYLTPDGALRMTPPAGVARPLPAVVVPKDLPWAHVGMPAASLRHRWRPVSIKGQVPVAVSGPVVAGDYLVANPVGDGTAVALPWYASGEVLGQVVSPPSGRALPVTRRAALAHVHMPPMYVNRWHWAALAVACLVAAVVAGVAVRGGVGRGGVTVPVGTHPTWHAFRTAMVESSRVAAPPPLDLPSLYPVSDLAAAVPPGNLTSVAEFMLDTRWRALQRFWEPTRVYSVGDVGALLEGVPGVDAQAWRAAALNQGAIEELVVGRGSWTAFAAATDSFCGAAMDLAASCTSPGCLHTLATCNHNSGLAARQFGDCGEAVHAARKARNLFLQAGAVGDAVDATIGLAASHLLACNETAAAEASVAGLAAMGATAAQAAVGGGLAALAVAVGGHGVGAGAQDAVDVLVGEVGECQPAVLRARVNLGMVQAVAGEAGAAASTLGAVLAQFPPKHWSPAGSGAASSWRTLHDDAASGCPWFPPRRTWVAVALHNLGVVLGRGGTPPPTWLPDVCGAAPPTTCLSTLAAGLCEGGLCTPPSPTALWLHQLDDLT